MQGLSFVNNHDLAVAPEEGGVHVHTLDPDELVRIARAHRHVRRRGAAYARDHTPITIGRDVDRLAVEVTDQ